MLIRDAAPLTRGVDGHPLTARNLQKRIKNSVTTSAGRSRWTALGVDPDTVGYGLDDELTREIIDVVGLELATEPAEQKATPQEEAPASEPEPTPAPRPRPAPKAPAKPERAAAPAPAPEQVKTTPGWLVGTLVAVAPIAEGYSFAKIGTVAYPDLGPMGQAGWAFIGYSVGLIAFVNYARIEDQTKAEVWAVVLALLQFLTHMSAAGWKLDTATASLLIVAASWAINAAWKKK